MPKITIGEIKMYLLGILIGMAVSAYGIWMRWNEVEKLKAERSELAERTTKSDMAIRYLLDENKVLHDRLRQRDDRVLKHLLEHPHDAPEWFSTLDDRWRKLEKYDQFFWSTKDDQPQPQFLKPCRECHTGTNHRQAFKFVQPMKIQFFRAK